MQVILGYSSEWYSSLDPGPIWTFSLRGILTFVASGLDINGCVLSYFEGTANLHCYTSCTLTTLHCSKVSFLQCCHMKRYNKIFTKMWGVYSLLWDTVYMYVCICICIYVCVCVYMCSFLVMWSGLGQVVSNTDIALVFKWNLCHWCFIHTLMGLSWVWRMPWTQHIDLCVFACVIVSS